MANLIEITPPLPKPLGVPPSLIDLARYDASLNTALVQVWVRMATRLNLALMKDGSEAMTGDLLVPDEAYDATNWNGDLSVPTKNAVRDKIETLQPLDADLTAIAALSTTAYGRSLLTLADDDALGAEIVDLPLTWAAQQTFSTPPQLPTFTVGTLPSDTPGGRLIYVSDESGGPTVAYSDGSDWRRVYDNAVVS